MALTKISTGMISEAVGNVDLNIDANTMFIDVSTNRVGINNNSPAVPLDVTGAVNMSSTLDLTSHLDMPDSAIIKLGTGDDLQIYHDSNNSHIKNDTGDLYVRSDSNVYITNAATSKNSIAADTDGAVTLYFNNAAKLATASGGIDVTGTVVCDGGNFDGACTFNDTGADADFRIEGDSDTNLFFIDAGNDRVGIGTGTPQDHFHLAKTGFWFGSNSDYLRLVQTNTNVFSWYGPGFGYIQHWNPNTGEIKLAGSLVANGGVVFNEDSADKDFRVESNNNANMLFVDGGNDRVGIGTASPNEALEVSRTSTDQTNGLIIENLQAGGYGSGIAFESKRSDDSSVSDAAKIYVSGTNSWNSSGSRTSAMNFGVIGDGTFAVRAQINKYNGIAFGTDSAEANTLDDYEEGTWTPEIEDIGGRECTLSTANGSYTKIGRMVLLNFQVTVSATPAGWTGNYILMKNYPYPHPTQAYNGTGHIDYFSGWNAGMSSLGFDTSSTTTKFWLVGIVGDGAYSSIYIPTSYFGGNEHFKGSIIYQTSV